MEQKQSIEEQLKKLNGYLRDLAWAVSIAAAQDAAYYLSQGKEVPPFEADKSAVVKKSIKDEKIAINIAGFYAVECGIGVLVAKKGNTAVYWLEKIVHQELDAAEMLLLNRFANATWKAGQPFRSLSRITRDNFIVASFLNAEETQKDHHQVVAAASKLLGSLKDVTDQSKEEQFKKISQLMKDKAFALEMAKHLEAAYYLAQKKPVPPFTSPDDDTATTEKNVFEEKVATNIAGFYALECGLSYMASAQHQLPSEVLQSIVDSSITEENKQLLERFANATWKAGQPFRSLDRIERDIFTPFYFLSNEEIEKDWVQITTMAKRLIKLL